MYRGCVTDRLDNNDVTLGSVIDACFVRYFRARFQSIFKYKIKVKKKKNTYFGIEHSFIKYRLAKDENELMKNSLE